MVRRSRKVRPLMSRHDHGPVRGLSAACASCLCRGESTARADTVTKRSGCEPVARNAPKIVPLARLGLEILKSALPCTDPNTPAPNLPALISGAVLLDHVG